MANPVKPHMIGKCVFFLGKDGVVDIRLWPSGRYLNSFERTDFQSFREDCRDAYRYGVSGNRTR